MTSFTRAWTDAYEGLPPNSEDARKGASRIRDLKGDIHERMSVDHSWKGDEFDGQHIKVTMVAQATDPDTVPNGVMYVKQTGTSYQLFWKDNLGVVTQLSFTQGTGSSIILPGAIIPFANQDFPVLPGYLQCKGQVISRATYSELFGAI